MSSTPGPTVLEIDTGDQRQVRRFLELPFRLYRDCPQWVPPLQSDVRRALDRKRHPFYQHSQAAFWLALDASGQPMGRLACLDNHNFNAFNSSRTAFFHFFECAEDPRAAQALFDCAFAWARNRGLTEMIGPKGLTALDGLGLLVRGFEHRPAFGIAYNHAYYGDLVDTAGFQPDGDLVSGYLSRAAAHFPEKIHQVAELVKQRRGLQVKTFRSRSELRQLVPQIKELYNASLGGTSGNVPLTEDEARTLGSQLLWFADPALIKIITHDGQPVGFLFAYPDISAALQRTRGRLFPFGWLPLWLELRRTRWININGAGIVERYRGLGGTALLFSELAKTIIDSRFDHADIVQIGMDNDRMLRELRDLGIDFYKQHRMYRRAL